MWFPFAWRTYGTYVSLQIDGGCKQLRSSLMQQECMSVYVSACQYVCLSSVAPALQKLSKAMSREKHHNFESAGYVCMSVLEKVLEKLLLKSSEMFWSFAKQSPTSADTILTENPCRWKKPMSVFAMSSRPAPPVLRRRRCARHICVGQPRLETRDDSRRLGQHPQRRAVSCTVAP